MVKRGKDSSLLFNFEEGCLLTKQRFEKAVREAMSKAGMDAKLYSGYSFRIGAVPMAGRKGLSAE